MGDRKFCCIHWTSGSGAQYSFLVLLGGRELACWTVGTSLALALHGAGLLGCRALCSIVANLHTKVLKTASVDCTPSTEADGYLDEAEKS